MLETNYQLLGRKWDYCVTFQERLGQLAEDDAKCAAASRDAEAREIRIRRKLMYPCLQHLGFGVIDDVRERVEHGVDLAVEYFTGSWWRPEELLQYELDEAEFHFQKELNLRAMDKSRPDRKLRWYDAFKSALFLAGLSARWDDLGKICAWFDATIEPQYQAGMIEDEYQQLFICIAGSLSPQSMPGADELLAKVKKCRTKRPRLLCAAWEAANAADQSAFNKAFPETVKQFLSRPEDGQVYSWLAIDQSSVWFIAEHRGLKLPPLSEKMAAAVVTRESAGLV